MKKILFTLLLTGLVVSFSKPNAAEFKFRFKTYNQDEGVDWLIYYYHLDGNELHVLIVRNLADSRSEGRYTTTLTPQAIAKLQAIKLDGLESNYVNRCMPEKNGREYEISAGYGNDVKEITLHHYYKEEIAQLAAELNKSLPEEYQIDYLGADTKQDCK